MLEITGGFGGVLVFAQDWANWQATQRSLQFNFGSANPFRCQKLCSLTADKRRGTFIIPAHCSRAGNAH